MTQVVWPNIRFPIFLRCTGNLSHDAARAVLGFGSSVVGRTAYPVRPRQSGHRLGDVFLSRLDTPCTPLGLIPRSLPVSLPLLPLLGPRSLIAVGCPNCFNVRCRPLGHRDTQEFGRSIGTPP